MCVVPTIANTEGMCSLAVASVKMSRKTDLDFPPFTLGAVLQRRFNLLRFNTVKECQG